MSILSNSILDNLKRNLSNKDLYTKQLGNLPKGKIVIRKKSDYYYLDYRDNEKIIYKYLGPVLSFDISDFQRQLEERRIINERIKNFKNRRKRNEKGFKDTRDNCINNIIINIIFVINYNNILALLFRQSWEGL